MGEDQRPLNPEQVEPAPDLRRLVARRPFEARPAAAAVSRAIERGDPEALLDQGIERPRHAVMAGGEGAMEEHQARPLAVIDGTKGSAFAEIEIVILHLGRSDCPTFGCAQWVRQSGL